MNKKTIAAIDIGTTKIVALTGQSVGENKVEVLAVGKQNSIGVERGVVYNVEKAALSIKKAINDLSKNGAGNIDEVWVGIAGQHVRSIKSSNTIRFDNQEHEITYDDIELLLKESFEINTSPNELVVNVAPQSFEIKAGTDKKSPLGKKSDYLKGNFHLTIAQEDAFANINKSLEINNIKAKELVLESIASAKSVLDKDEINKGIALVDIGGGTSDLAIFKNGSVVHSAVIPFGGEVVTSDIEKAFNLEKRYAEALKQTYGSLLQGSNSKEVIVLKNKEGKKVRIKQQDLTIVIKSRIEEIIDLIKFQMELSGYANQIPKGIVLTGGGALLKDITQLYAFHFKNLPVKVGKPNKQFFSGKFDENLNEPIFSTATGLLLFGIEDEKLQQEQQLIIDKQKQDKEKPVEEKTESKGNAFSAIRRRLSGMFNEEDDTLE